MIRTLLIYPPRGFTDEDLGILELPQLGIAYLANFLRKNNYEVALCDLNILAIHDYKLFKKIRALPKKVKDENEAKEIIGELLKKADYKGKDLVGFSLIDSCSVDLALLLAKEIKKRTKCKIVLGGLAVTESLINYDFIDFLIMGDGEEALLNLCKHLENKLPIEKVGNLIYKKDNRIMKNFGMHTGIENKFPDFDGLNLDYYRNIPSENIYYTNEGKLLILNYAFIDGCLFDCSFCGNSLSKKKYMKARPIPQIIKEIKFLSKKYNTKYFCFLDPHITISEKFINEFCDQLIKSKLDILWSDCAKPVILNSRLLKKMRKSGCVMLALGIETGSEKILRSMTKGHTVAQSSKLLKEAHEAGIWNYLDMIVGYPGETEEDFNDTMKFVKDNLEYIDQICPQTFRLSPSKIYNNPREYGIRKLDPVKKVKFGDHDVCAYEEINGRSWEEIKKDSDHRMKKLIQYFLNLKKASLDNRDVPYNLYYYYKTFNNKKDIYSHLRKKAKEGQFLGEGEISEKHLGLETYKPKNFCKEYVKIKKDSGVLIQFMATALGLKKSYDDWFNVKDVHAVRELAEKYGLFYKLGWVFTPCKNVDNVIDGGKMLPTTRMYGKPYDSKIKGGSVHVFFSKDERYLDCAFKNGWYPLIVNGGAMHKPYIDFLRFGYFLGYPDCCVDFFRRYNNHLMYNFQYEIKKHTKGTFNKYCNPILKNDTYSYIFHMPCSFNCSNTISYVKKLRKELINLEPRLVNKTDDMLKKPLLVFNETLSCIFEGYVQDNNIFYKDFSFLPKTLYGVPKEIYRHLKLGDRIEVLDNSIRVYEGQTPLETLPKNAVDGFILNFGD